MYPVRCASLLGHTGDKQVVSLQRLGCVSFGIIQHEIMHALGFHHEHTRSDRDQYVRINWDKIIECKYHCKSRDRDVFHFLTQGLFSFADFKQDFEKADTDNLNTPYDYSSIMHYSKYVSTEQRYINEKSTCVLQSESHSKYLSLSCFKIHRNAFGKDWADTITPIPDPNVPIGLREHMSTLDVLRINKLYKCQG